MNKGLWIGIGAAGLALLAALRLTGGERGHEPLGPGVEGGVVQGPGEPEPLSRPEAAEDGVAPVEIAPAGSPTREPTLPGPWAERPIVVHGRLVELLEIGERQPSRPAAGHRISLEEGRRGGPVVEAVTRSDGIFRFELAPRSERPFVYTLRVAGDERYRPIRHQRNLNHGVSKTEPQLLRRVLHGVPHGEVVDRRGRPLSGVAILCGEERVEELRLFSGLDGSFELTGREPYDAFAAEADGYRLVKWKVSSPRKLGGWTTGRFTLGATTRLDVRVLDDEGGPVEGARVHVEPTDGPRLSADRERTDAEGRATFPAAWCETPLEVSISTDDFQDSTRAHLGGELRFGESADGEPIVLSPTAPTELRAHLSRRLQLVCRLENRHVYDVSVLVRSQAERSFRDWMDESGPDTLTLAVPARLQRAPLIVTAAEAREGPRAPITLAHRDGEGEDSGPPRLAPGEEVGIARAIVDPVLAVNGRLEVLLRLEPALSIRGSLVGDFWRPKVWAVRSGSRDPLSDFRESEAYRSKEGTFELAGLAPGRYDVIVAAAQGKWGSDLEIVHGVAAGTQGLEIALPATDEVVVHLVPDDEPVPMKEVRVMTMREVSTLSGARGGAPARLDRIISWGEGIDGRTGIHASVQGGGSSVIDTMRYRRSAVVHLPPTQVGDYRIAVLAESVDGKEFAAVSSPTMHLTAGEHTLRYALIPTGEVKVDCSRVGDQGVRVRLHHTERGAISMGDPRGRRELEVGRRKTLYLRRIPVGRYELLAGTAEELEAGRAAWTVPVEVRDDERTRVRIGPE